MYSPKIKYFLNWKRAPSQTFQLTKLEKRDLQPTLLLQPGLQSLCFTLLVSPDVLIKSKNGVELVEITTFYKSTSSQTVW